jgi:hypothetical protein
MPSAKPPDAIPIYHRTPVIPLLMYGAVSVTIYNLMGPPILILVVPFALAYIAWFTWFRHHPIVPTTRFLRLYLLMYVIQLFHLMEEWITGFYRTFPALWGSVWFGDPARYPAWGQVVFINGNLAMDAFWEVAILLFPKRNAWANYTAWLFLSGMVVNAVGHPLYSIWLATHPSLQAFLGTSYGYHYTWYFPGLFTSFAHAIIATLVIRQLRENYRLPADRPFPSLGEALGSLDRSDAGAAG